MLQYEKEAILAAKEVKKRKLSVNANDSSESLDLMKAIQSRQSSRAYQQNDFLERLAAKYSKKSEKSRKKK